MITIRRLMCLDGDFKRAHPAPVRWSWRDGPNWGITTAGPRYFNTYEVTDFDDAGEKWLLEHLDQGDRDACPRQAEPSANSPVSPDQGSLEL